MTNRQAALAAYGHARQTLSPLRIIVELYDAALTAVAHARHAKGSGDSEKEFRSLTKAAQILQGLDGCLKKTDRRAKPMADTLHSFYRQTLIQLHAAKRMRGKGGIAQYTSVHRQILTMREAWADLAAMPSLTIKPRQDLPGARQTLPGLAQNVPAGQRLDPP